jgi:hypothetical protein
MKGSHNMAIERVLVTIRGGTKEGTKRGEWKNIVAIERFSIAIQAWRLKGF